MKYTVVEVQECTRIRAWSHEVEADSPEEAIRLVADGRGELLNDGGAVGDEDFGDSAFAVVQDGNEDAARAVALDRLLGGRSGGEEQEGGDS